MSHRTKSRSSGRQEPLRQQPRSPSSEEQRSDRRRFVRRTSRRRLPLTLAAESPSRSVMALEDWRPVERSSSAGGHTAGGEALWALALRDEDRTADVEGAAGASTRSPFISDSWEAPKLCRQPEMSFREFMHGEIERQDARCRSPSENQSGRLRWGTKWR